MIRALLDPKEHLILEGPGAGQQRDLAKELRDIVQVGAESFGLPEEGHLLHTFRGGPGEVFR